METRTRTNPATRASAPVPHPAPAFVKRGRMEREWTRRGRDRAREEQRMFILRGGAWIRAPTGFFTFSRSL